MILTILIIFFSLIGLIVLHELGHFILAKIFGVKVEEFGIFLPPRLIGKKIGETIYSLNLLPFGAFVKLYGEEGKVAEASPHLPSRSTLSHSTVEDIRSFSEKPIWQRVLIIVGGVATFWIISVILLSIVMSLGVSVEVADEENGGLVDPKVQVLFVAPASPAELAGIKIGDTLKQFNKVREVQEFTEEHKGEEVTLTIGRGKETFEVNLIPRLNPPEDEGAIGIALARTAIKSYPWYQAPIKGIEATLASTETIIISLAQVLKGLVLGKGLPPGVQLVGPIGMGALMIQFAELGASYYLHFIAVISIYLAIFNILPIPALDGGKLVFLVVEAVKKKPISPKVEQRITTVFFTLLIALIIWVTINDIIRLF